MLWIWNNRIAVAVVFLLVALAIQAKFVSHYHDQAQIAQMRLESANLQVNALNARIAVQAQIIQNASNAEEAINNAPEPEKHVICPLLSRALRSLRASK